MNIWREVQPATPELATRLRSVQHGAARSALLPWRSPLGSPALNHLGTIRPICSGPAHTCAYVGHVPGKVQGKPMPLLFHWHSDNYCHDLNNGVGYHLNQANPLMHQVEVGDSLGAFARAHDGRYALAAELVSGDCWTTALCS